MWEARQPLGVLRNSLPNLWLCVRDDGSLWIMLDKSHSESTGAQVCLATISAETMAVLRGSAREPYHLQIAPEGS